MKRLFTTYNLSGLLIAILLLILITLAWRHINKSPQNIFLTFVNELRNTKRQLNTAYSTNYIDIVKNEIETASINSAVGNDGALTNLLMLKNDSLFIYSFFGPAYKSGHPPTIHQLNDSVILVSFLISNNPNFFVSYYCKEKNGILQLDSVAGYGLFILKCSENVDIRLKTEAFFQ